MSKIFKYISNKYLLVTLAFLVQLVVFENIDLFSLKGMKNKENGLMQTVKKQEKEIEEKRQSAMSLSDSKERERFGREKYHFKKPNEKIFIITNE